MSDEHRPRVNTGVDIHEIHRSLMQIEEELIAKIPEQLFIDHILPIIANDPEHTSLEPWEHLAGSTFNKIAVQDRQGNTLFVLPPLAVSPNFDQNSEARHSLYEAMEHYRLLAAVHPRSAARYLDGKLSSIIKPRSRDYEALLLIDNVLERYGRPRRIPKEFLEQMMRSDSEDQNSTSEKPVSDTSDETVSDIGDDL